MKGLADGLAAAGRPIDEGELMEYLLAGLDDTYNPLFAAIGVNGAEDLTVSDLYAQVVAYENRIELLSDTGGSVNAASHGHGAGAATMVDAEVAVAMVAAAKVDVTSSVADAAMVSVEVAGVAATETATASSARSAAS
jgi:hypothetical protein